MLTKGLFTSNRKDWRTPRDLFNSLDKIYHFTLDACATPENALCEKYYTEQEDGLKQSWDGEVVYCNPPYGREIGKWVKKASETNGTVVMLLPARTDTKWFHKYIWDRADNNKPVVRFLKGRLSFDDSGNPAPFPSMIVIFENVIE